MDACAIEEIAVSDDFFGAGVVVVIVVIFIVDDTLWIGVIDVV